MTRLTAMPPVPPHSPEEEIINQEAIDWIIQSDLGLSAERKPAFEAWLASDPRCREFFDRNLRVWKCFDAPLDESATERFKQSVASRVRALSRQRLFWAARVAGLAAAVVAMIAWIVVSRPGGGAAFESNFSSTDYQNRILTDGTIIEFNLETEVRARIQPNLREVWLLAGEAHFHVAKDPSASFVVHAGGTEIRAIGTAFNVRLTEDFVDVLVTEGRVSMLHGDDGRQSFLKEESGVSQRSTLSRVDKGAHFEIHEVSEQEMNDLLAWKPEVLEFTATPLREVIVAFNKRNEVQLRLEDPDLGNMQIEASFRSHNVENFARLLKMTFGIEGTPIGKDEILLRKPD